MDLVALRSRGYGHFRGCYRQGGCSHPAGPGGNCPGCRGGSSRRRSFVWGCSPGRDPALFWSAQNPIQSAPVSGADLAVVRRGLTLLRRPPIAAGSAPTPYWSVCCRTRVPVAVGASRTATGTGRNGFACAWRWAVRVSPTPGGILGRVSPPERRYPLRRRADGLWVQPDPLSCPTGEWLDLVPFKRGYTQCGNPDHGGHLYWLCFHCERYLFDPPCDLNGDGFKAG